MNIDEYKEKGKDVIDYIAEYLQNIRQRRVFPDVQPGYMRELVPSEAPIKGENWDEIFKDVERVVMPGITHWQSPHMHAYFPALNSFPSLLGDMIAEAINCLGFTWASSPAATELESLVLDWLVKCLGLPDKFLNSNQEPFGGGSLQTTASDATYYSLLAARTKIFSKYGVAEIDKYIEKAEIMGRLVCYCSEQAHSSVEKAALIAITRIRLLHTDENLSLRGETLRKAIEQDKKDGLIPFYVCATLGTTGVCAFDNLEEIGTICKEEDLWLHIDAAYAGSALICPEFRKFSKGIEYATSFVFNPSKWLMVNFDCTCFWVESSIPLHQTFTVAPLYLKHKYSGAAIDYMHWQVGLSRRFRALKLWFVIRSFGIEGLQKHIYKSVQLAKLFEELVRNDNNFELIAERHLGLVVFRLKGENELTEHLLKELNKDGKIHVVPAKVHNKYIIRFTVTSYYTTEADIKRDWEIIKSIGYCIILNKENDLKLHIDQFQSSLLLSNVAQTPKIVNASFAAFFQNDLSYRDLSYRGYTQSHLPLTPRRKPRSNKNRFFNVKGTSLDQLTSMQMGKLSLINNKNADQIDLNLDENLEDNNTDNLEQEYLTNGKSNLFTISNINSTTSNLKAYNKQSSLDSKIEHIFQIAEAESNDIDSASSAFNSILNRSQPNPEIRRNSKEINIKN